MGENREILTRFERWDLIVGEKDKQFFIRIPQRFSKILKIKKGNMVRIWIEIKNGKNIITLEVNPKLLTIDYISKKIFNFLKNSKDKHSVYEIAEKLGVSWNTVDAHLKKLYKSNHVTLEQNGKIKLWKINIKYKNS